MATMKQAIEGLTLFINNKEKKQWQRVNPEKVVEGVNQVEQPRGHHYEEVH